MTVPQPLKPECSELRNIVSSKTTLLLSLLRYKCSRGSFLLTNALQNITKINTGTCPHGLSPGACPICSGMGGGGSRVGERPQKAGEMSYHQCAMIGAMMKAREQRLEAHEKNLQARLDALLQFQDNMAKMSAKMLAFANSISSNFVLKPVAYIISNIVVPIFNAVKNIPNVISNFSAKISQFKQKVIDIQDKLNAIFGEAKAFVEKKISEIVTALKSNLRGLFKVFEKNNINDEDTKIDDDKKIFNLKTIIHRIWKKKKDDTENKSGS